MPTIKFADDRQGRNQPIVLVAGRSSVTPFMFPRIRRYKPSIALTPNLVDERITGLSGPSDIFNGVFRTAKTKPIVIALYVLEMAGISPISFIREIIFYLFSVVVRHWPVDHVKYMYHARLLHPKPLLKSNLNHYGFFEATCRTHVAVNLN